MPEDECGFCGVFEGAVVTASWPITVHELEVKSQNAYHGIRGADIRKYKADRNRWEWLFYAKMTAGKIPKAKRFRRARITRFCKTKRELYDYGNFVGGLKPVVDAMKNVGLIVDDRPSMFFAGYRQVVTNAVNHHLSILLEEVEGDDARHR